MPRFRASASSSRGITPPSSTRTASRSGGSRTTRRSRRPSSSSSARSEARHEERTTDDAVVDKFGTLHYMATSILRLFHTVHMPYDDHEILDELENGVLGEQGTSRIT